MEISCYYLHFNRFPRSIVFIRNNDLVYITTNNIGSVVISFDELMSYETLYGYYLLSLHFTQDITKVTYFEEGRPWAFTCSDDNKWCISAKVFWKTMYITCYFENLYGFKSDPRTWKLSHSSDKKTKKFITNFYTEDDFDMDPFDILNLTIMNEIGELESELLLEEKIIDKLNFSIKTAAYMTSKTFQFSLPLDLVKYLL